jgi:hypothetical protein
LPCCRKTKRHLYGFGREVRLAAAVNSHNALVTADGAHHAVLRPGVVHRQLVLLAHHLVILRRRRDEHGRHHVHDLKAVHLELIPSARFTSHRGVSPAIRCNYVHIRCDRVVRKNRENLIRKNNDASDDEQRNQQESSQQFIQNRSNTDGVSLGGWVKLECSIPADCFRDRVFTALLQHRRDMRTATSHFG